MSIGEKNFRFEQRRFFNDFFKNFEILSLLFCFFFFCHYKAKKILLVLANHIFEICQPVV